MRQKHAKNCCQWDILQIIQTKKLLLLYFPFLIKEPSGYRILFLGHIHHLDGLQHVGERDHQVSGLHHTPGLQQGEGAVEVALHVIGLAEPEWDETPLEVQPSPDGHRGCERKDRAVGAAS